GPRRCTELRPPPDAQPSPGLSDAGPQLAGHQPAQVPVGPPHRPGRTQPLAEPPRGDPPAQRAEQPDASGADLSARRPVGAGTPRSGPALRSPVASGPRRTQRPRQPSPLD